MSVDSFEASVKKSDALKEDLFEHPTKYVMLTGDRPTGRLHLGHYFGTIKERVNLQNKGVPTRVVIADYQVITDRDTTEHIQDNVYNMVIDYLACGLDPEKRSSSRILRCRRSTSSCCRSCRSLPNLSFTAIPR